MICVRGLVCACALLLLGAKYDVGCVSDAYVGSTYRYPCLLVYLLIHGDFF